MSLVLVTLKIFLQTLWKKNDIWDEELQDNMLQQFQQWLKRWKSGVVDVSKLIPFDDDKQLHVYVDPSKLAYAAVVYIVNRGKEGKEVHIVLAKLRLATVKEITIPHMELHAVLIEVRIHEEAAHASVNQALPLFQQS